MAHQSVSESKDRAISKYRAALIESELYKLHITQWSNQTGTVMRDLVHEKQYSDQRIDYWEKKVRFEGGNIDAIKKSIGLNQDVFGARP